MANARLYNVAKRYVDIVEQMQRVADPQALANLEEERVIWHNRLLRTLRREGVAFTDREHVTRIAYHIVRTNA